MDQRNAALASFAKDNPQIAVPVAIAALGGAMAAAVAPEIGAAIAANAPALTQATAAAGGLVPGTEGAMLTGATASAVMASGNEVVSASKNAAQSLTGFGKALTKHAEGQRASGTLPKLSGSNSEINAKGAKLAEGILSNPASTAVDNRVTTVVNDAGQGVRFNNETNKFIGFIDPEKK